MTEVDLSNKGLQAAGAIIVAAWISHRDKGALTKLVLKNNGLLTADGGKALADMITANTTLKELDVSSNHWFNNGWQGDAPGFAKSFAVGLIDNEALLSLNVADNRPGSGWNGWSGSTDGSRALSNALKGNTTLTELNVSSNHFKADDARILADGVSDHEAILSVNLLHNSIGIDQAQNLARILKEHPTLKSLCGNSGEETDRTELDMSGKEIGAEGAIMLAPEIADNGALSSLNVANNKLGELLDSANNIWSFSIDKWWCNGTEPPADNKKGYKDAKPLGIITLANAIKDMGALTSLNISSNRLTWGALKSSGAIALTNAIKDMGALSIANVMGNSIGKQMLSKLQEIMRSKPNLVSLCGITNDATEADLSGLGMDADDATILASELPDKGVMTILNISGNNLFNDADEGASVGKVLGAMLQTNSTLRELDVSDSKAVWDSPGGPRFAQELAVGLRDNGSLTHLDVSGNASPFWGQLVPPEGWVRGNYIPAKGPNKYHWSCTDGRKEEGVVPSESMPDGIIALADAIPSMGALTSLNLPKSGLGVEGAKIIAAVLPGCT
jgi:Ran GTPase-activating protein (RanGAP) involved in mRNA processing and transport